MANEVTFTLLHQKYCELKNCFKKHGVPQQFELCWDMSVLRSNCNDIINDIESKMKTVHPESTVWFRLLAMKGVIFNFQVDFLLLFENLGLAMEILIENFRNMHPFGKGSYVAFIYLQTIQKIASICKIKDDLCSAQEILETAIEIYESAKDQGFCENEDLFSPNETVEPKYELAIQFDKTYIFILEMLRIIHDSKKNCVASILLQHHILNIQLKNGDESLFMWLQNLIRLSNQLTHLQFYGCARHHLSVATHKLETLKKLFGEKEIENGRENVLKVLEGLEANLALVWIKYSLSLFVCSKKKHLELCSLKKNINETSCSEEKGDELFKVNLNLSSDEVEKKTFVECKAPMTDETQRAPITIGKTDEKIDAIKFQLDVSVIESLVRCELIKTTNQAKDLFEFVLKWFSKAGDYYEFKDFPSAYITLMLDLSEFHKCLAFFEPNLPERYQLHQKRQTILNILKSLSTQLDPMAFVDTHVEIMRELAQVHLDLLNSDLESLREIKGFALNRLKHNYTQSYHLEKQISNSVELLEAQLNSLGMFQNHFTPSISL